MARRLKDHEDAFGRALHDHLHGGDGVEIVERSDGYIDVSLLDVTYFSPFSKWPEHEKAAAERIRGRMLDIGCGAGRFLLHAQEHGIPCVGIDLSPLAVEVCRRRGVKEVHELSISEVGPDLGEFRTVIFMGNNFGLFGDAQRGHRLLKRFHRLTPDDGLMIAEVLDPSQTEDPFHLAYQAENRRRGRMPGQIRLRIRYKAYKTPWYDYLFVSPHEMEAIAAGTGWRLTEVIESDGPAYVGVLEKE